MATKKSKPRAAPGTLGAATVSDAIEEGARLLANHLSDEYKDEPSVAAAITKAGKGLQDIADALRDVAAAIRDPHPP